MKYDHGPRYFKKCFCELRNVVFCVMENQGAYDAINCELNEDIFRKSTWTFVVPSEELL